MKWQAEDEDREDGHGRQDRERHKEEEHDEVEQIVGKVVVSGQISDRVIERVECDNTACEDPDRKQ